MFRIKGEGKKEKITENKTRKLSSVSQRNSVEIFCRGGPNCHLKFASYVQWKEVRAFKFKQRERPYLGRLRNFIYPFGSQCSHKTSETRENVSI